MSSMSEARAKLEEALPKANWTKDRFGHYQRTAGGRNYRIRMQATSCRVEIQVHHDDGSKSWVKTGGCYYRDIHFTAAGPAVPALIKGRNYVFRPEV